MRMKIIFPVRLGLAPCFRRRQYQCFVGFQLNYQWFILRFLLFRIFMSILLISYLPLQIILLFCNDQCISKVTYVEAYLMCSLFVYSSLNFYFSLCTLTEWHFLFPPTGYDAYQDISNLFFTVWCPNFCMAMIMLFFLKYVIVCTYIMATRAGKVTETKSKIISLTLTADCTWISFTV